MPVKPSHAMNVPGDFYVEDGCCISCAVPSEQAPGHFEFDSQGHCFVCKQPSSKEEVVKMIRAVADSEVSCIRYAGNDSEVLEQLVALKQNEQCDVLVPETQPTVVQPKGTIQKLINWLRKL